MLQEEECVRSQLSAVSIRRKLVGARRQCNKVVVDYKSRRQDLKWLLAMRT
jgi:hypothetical protein